MEQMNERLRDSLIDSFKISVIISFNNKLDLKSNIIALNPFYRAQCEGKNLLYITGLNKFYKFMFSSDIDPGLACINMPSSRSINSTTLDMYFVNWSAIIDKVICNVKLPSYTINRDSYSDFDTDMDTDMDMDMDMDTDMDMDMDMDIMTISEYINQDIYYFDKKLIEKKIKDDYIGFFVNSGDILKINIDDKFENNVNLEIQVFSKGLNGYINRNTVIDVLANDCNIGM